MNKHLSDNEINALLSDVALSPFVAKAAREALRSMDVEKVKSLKADIALVSRRSQSVRAELKRLRETQSQVSMKRKSETQSQVSTKRKSSIEQLEIQLQKAFAGISYNFAAEFAATLRVSNPGLSAYFGSFIREVILRVSREVMRPAMLKKIVASSNFSTNQYTDRPILLEGPTESDPDVFALIENRSGLTPFSCKKPSLLSVPEAHEAIAKCEAVTRLWSPTFIVAINAGGGIIGDYLGYRLRMDKKRVLKVTLDKKAEGPTFSNHPRFQSNSRVLIVDDIARSGRTVKTIYRFLKKSFPKTSMQCVTLAAMHSGSSGVVGEVPWYSACYTSDANVALPWETHGELLFKNGVYIIGAGDNTIAITNNEANLAYKEVEAEA